VFKRLFFNFASILVLLVEFFQSAAIGLMLDRTLLAGASHDEQQLNLRSGII
jgi:hypothetical protein